MRKTTTTFRNNDPYSSQICNLSRAELVGNVIYYGQQLQKYHTLFITTVTNYVDSQQTLHTNTNYEASKH